MGCLKSLTLEEGGCELENCVDASKVNSDFVNAIVFASDICYACVITQSFTPPFDVTFNKYDPAENSLIPKASFTPPSSISSNGVYDVIHQRVVICSGTRVFAFSPVDDSVVTFDSGISSLFQMVYIPQKGRIYGEFGVDGLGQTFIGHIDLDLQIIVQLGVIPSVGPSDPRPTSLVYVPSQDSVYGCWQTGLAANLAKFNLTTNIGIGNVIGAGLEGGNVTFDTVRNRIIAVFGTVKEIDPTTDTVVFTGPVGPSGGNFSGTNPANSIFVASINKCFGIGSDIGTGQSSINSYDCITQTTGSVRNDYPNTYFTLASFGGGSMLVNSFHDISSQDGIQRICAT